MPNYRLLPVLRLGWFVVVGACVTVPNVTAQDAAVVRSALSALDLAALRTYAFEERPLWDRAIDLDAPHPPRWTLKTGHLWTPENRPPRRVS